MSLKERIAADLRDALRAGEKTRLSAVRMLQAAITEREKSGAGPLTEEDYLAVVQKQAKQRRDAAEQFRAAGRTDLAEREEAELAVVEGYLPAQLPDEEVERVVREVVERTGATSMKDMGRVMGEAMGALRGQADGRRVQAVVRALLQG
ncbi:MAG TPA: GatB/YqeY domain-containing protein [Rubricoccaceae bacterium]|nr:GatB/YqeY domain-containing protein [Rubricoccaceae bacterium]